MNFLVLIAIIISLYVFYFIGHTIRYYTNIFSESTNKYFIAFTNLIIGFIIIISIYAIIITRFNTIMLVFLLVFLLYVFSLYYFDKIKIVERKTDKYFSDNLVKNLIIIGIIGIAFYLLQALRYYNEPYNNIPFCDNIVYAVASNFLNDWGIETMNFNNNPVNQSKAFTSFYHYPELWLNAILIKVFKFNYLESFFVGTYTILASLFAMGMIALAETINKKLFYKFFAVATMFFMGLILYNPNNQTETVYFSMGLPKHILIALLYVWTMLLYLQKHKYFYIPLLLMPVINMAMSPVTYISISAVYILWTLINKRFHLLLKYLFCITVISLFIYVFYFIINKTPESPSNYSILNDIESIKSTFTIVLYHNAVILSSSYYIYLLLMLIFIPFTNIKKLFADINYYAGLIIFLIISTAVALVTYAIMINMIDSFQIFYLPIPIMLAIFIFVGFTFIGNYLKNRFIKCLYYVTLLLLCIFNVNNLIENDFFKLDKAETLYDIEYLDNTFAYLEQNEDNRLGALYINPDSLDTYWNATARTYQLDVFWAQLDDYYVTEIYSPFIDYNNFEENEAERLKNQIWKTDFYQFVDQWHNTTTPSDSLQYYYVLQNDIKYIRLLKNAQLPAVFNDIVDTVYENSVDKEKVVGLKLIKD